MHPGKLYNIFSNQVPVPKTILPKHEDTSTSDTTASVKTRTKLKKDPEHMAATRWWEVAGTHVRVFAKFMRSNHATHGLRVACAVMSVAIGFYIRTSSEWFSKNRWLWAMFAIVLTMNRTAGVSLFSYVCRIGGTALAMASSFAVYYMVDGHTAGALVMLWVWFLILGYLSESYSVAMGA